MGSFESNVGLVTMCIAELLVVLGCNFLCVERSKVVKALYHAVRGPLVPGQEEECVVVFLCFIAGGAALSGERMTTQHRELQQREFDSTRGFPGEDIAVFPPFCVPLSLFLFS